MRSAARVASLGSRGVRWRAKGARSTLGTRFPDPVWRHADCRPPPPSSASPPTVIWTFEDQYIQANNPRSARHRSGGDAIPHDTLG